MIVSVLDNDLYKFTMQQAVLEHYRGVPVAYKFKSRGSMNPIGAEFCRQLRSEINDLQSLSLSSDEAAWLKEKCPFLKPHYIEYLRNYRFEPDEVYISHTGAGDLVLSISGPWERTILWEVPLMALISEIYFSTVDMKVNVRSQSALVDVKRKAIEKAQRLTNAACQWADFGTRRRRSYGVQKEVVEAMRTSVGFIGTSNVALAKRVCRAPIGTMAHEWFMGVSVLESLRHANRFALQKWAETYKGNLGIALTDTFGTRAFFADFDLASAKLYDGVRHDSGDPYNFANAAIAHYDTLGIDPRSKTIVFSDGLDVGEAIAIKNNFESEIKVAFGIGTHFTNDFEGSPALNMVIKMAECNGVPVVKLSDEPGKVCGDEEAVRVVRWTHCGRRLERDC